MATPAPSSAPVPRSRSQSPPAASSSAPSEITSLLPSSSSRPRTATAHPAAAPRPDPRVHAAARKVSVDTRSVAGSVRGYGTVPPGRPSPSEQAPRVSKLGQRRILTTIPLRLSFFTLVTLTFLSLVLTLMLFVNTAKDLSAIALPYRGSGFTEFWISVVGSWIGLGAVLFFSHPSHLYFLTTLLSTILIFPILLLILLNAHLHRAHSPLFLVPLLLSAVILFITLFSNYLVRRARWKESQRVSRMLTEAAARERSGDEAGARAAVGLQKSVWRRVIGFIGGLLGFISGLVGLIVVALLLVDLSIVAYDSSVDLPSSHSRVVRVAPPSSPWSIQVHLACVGPPNSTLSTNSQGPHRMSLPRNRQRPTIIYEPSSGVPGSLALLDTPLPPASAEAENPGRWLMDMQEKGEIGRVCVWDRPGYGFSEVLAGADLGNVADTLYQVLESLGEIKEAEGGVGFMLIGEGYGGLLTRIFASRHPSLVHSLLHLDAQTAQTYFSESPHGFSALGLLAHRVTTRLLPSLLTPLSLTRLPSVLLRRSSSLSRTLGSTWPSPSTQRLSENLLKARLQETFGSHSHTSESFRALLESGTNYPSTKPAVVISSFDGMEKDERWTEGQRGLAEEVTSDEGLVGWEKVPGVGHAVCEGPGRKVCERAVRLLLK